GVLAVAVGAVALSLSGTTPEAETGDGDLPPLISRHLEALPDDGGLEGPGGAADQAFLERSYPAGTISVAQMDTARAAYTATKSRPFPGGKGQKGTRLSAGPG